MSGFARVLVADGEPEALAQQLQQAKVVAEDDRKRAEADRAFAEKQVVG
jgi:hypothetical protein